MSDSVPNVRLVMARQHWAEVPECSLPAGFSVRWYRPGDEACWRKIHLAAEREVAITPELFRQQFGTNEALLTRRQCYVLNARGEAVGTATAWFDEHFQGGDWGRVHWLAVMPDYQGQGLGRALLSLVCRRLQELGHTRAFLRTTATRLRAIKLYRAFGFVPLPQSEQERRLWDMLAPRLR